MALKINDNCSMCDACLDECPNQAITSGAPYVIDPAKCSECVGAFGEPQCQSVCPMTECIVLDPGHVEDRDALQAKYERLHAA